MKRLTILLLFLPICLMSLASDIKHIRFEYEYVSNNPNESPDQAERTAFERAKIKALEDHFGLDVSSINSIIQKNKSNGDNASSTTDVFSVRETSVRGEWVEVIEEKVLEKTFLQGFWKVRVRIEGRARNNSKEKVDIHYAFINNSHDKHNRDQYHDGDDIFLKFSSPVAGSLCIYLVDEEQNVFCLLPYMSTTNGCQSVEANKEYLFFSSSVDNKADEYTLNCQRSVEQNALYIVFTPNTLTKANDRQTGKNWRNEEMPRQLTYKDFISWLSRNQTRDEDMVVKTEMVTIMK